MSKQTPSNGVRRTAALENSQFSDESRARIYRRPNERFAAKCIQDIDRFGGESAMMWAAIAHNGKANLVHIDGNWTVIDSGGGHMRY